MSNAKFSLSAKKELIGNLTFIVFWMLWGVYIGFAGWLFPMMGKGRTDEVLLTIAEKAYFDAAKQGFLWQFGSNRPLFLTVMFVLWLGFFILLLSRLNSHFMAKSVNRTATYKRLAVGALSLPVFFLVSGAAVSSMIYAPKLDFLNSFLPPALFIIGMGLIWIIAGEQGWADDFSSWATSRIEGKPKLLRTFLQGASVGLAIFALSQVSSIFFAKFILPVTGIISDPDLGYHFGVRLSYGLAFCYSLSLGITGGFVIAMAPRYYNMPFQS
jgi:hypothetical protein